MTKMIYFLNLICIVLNGFVMTRLGPTSNFAFIFFTLWLSTPNLILIFLNHRSNVLYKKISQALIHNIVVLIVGGILVVDIIFIHPDPQGGMALLLVPIVQMVLLFITQPIINRFFKD